MEVAITSKMGRPKSENPKKDYVGIKMTQEERTRLKAYISRHDMTITQAVQNGLELLYLQEENTIAE